MESVKRKKAKDEPIGIPNGEQVEADIVFFFVCVVSLQRKMKEPRLLPLSLPLPLSSLWMTTESGSESDG